MIIVTRQCPFTGEMNEMELPITPWEFEAGYDAWKNGAFIQDAMPTLSADQREFVKTGITPQKWAEIYGEEN